MKIILWWRGKNYDREMKIMIEMKIIIERRKLWWRDENYDRDENHDREMKIMIERWK